MVVVLLTATVALGASPPQGTFTDDNGNTHEENIEAIAAEGIAKGCNPPKNDHYCPTDPVTRGQMAAFLHRALGGILEVGDPVDFVDDDDSIFEADIEWLGATGVTKGCNPPKNDHYCPDDLVTRGQMAAFLVRAMGYVDDGGGNLFIDDNRSIYENDIDRLATAGVTIGCNPPANDEYCPNDLVLRDQMASFLARALDLDTVDRKPDRGTTSTTTRNTPSTSSPTSSTSTTTSSTTTTTTMPSEPVLGDFIDDCCIAEFVPNAEALVTHIAPIDYGSDSDMDLFITLGNANGDQTLRNKFLENDGENLNDVAAFSRVDPGDFSHVVLGDLNGDGLDDAILSVTLAPARLQEFRSDLRVWVDVTAGHIPDGQPDDVTIASELLDCDLDGDLDIMTAVEDPFLPGGAQNRLYLNNGAAEFTDVTATNMPVILDDSAALAVGDFDSDGDPDVINVNAEADFYLQNDGSCGFSDESDTHLPAQPTNQDSGRDAAVEDFDGDGDLDIALAISRTDSGPVLWLNDGNGVFTDATDRIPLAALASQAIAACDLEGDGDLDLVVANSGAVLNPPTDHLFAGAPERILINDGNASFTDESDHIPQVNDGSQSVACVDVTGDGRMDIVVGNGKGESLKVYVQS